MILNEKIIIFKIQQLLAIVGTIIGITAVFTNSIIPEHFYNVNEKLLNIVVVLIFTAVFATTYFFNHRRMRLFQTLLAITIAVLSLLLEKRARIASDVFFIISTTMLYLYHIIKKFKFFHTFVIFGIMATLKFIGAAITNAVDFVQNFYSILFSTSLIVVIIMVKDYINNYIESTRLNNALHRISINAGSFLMNFNLEDLVSKLYALFPAEMLFNGNLELIQDVYDIGREIDKKDYYRRQLIAALELNGKTELEDVNVASAINNVIILYQINDKVYKSIDFFADHEDGLMIRVVPAEFYFMLQNLFTNIIEGLLKVKVHRQVSITSQKKGDQVVINIYYSEVNFKTFPPPKDKLFDFTPVWCRGIEYMRFLNARDMVHTYNGTIDFGNKIAKGYFILIKLPVFTPDPVGKKKCLEDTISQTL